MGGIGSGGGNRLSEEERRRRGTFRADRSDEEREAAKVVAGPWLATIPEPNLPLNAVGRKKYDELTKSLFEQNKLTTVTQMVAEQAAVLFQEQHRLLSEGKPVRASHSDKLQRALASLKIAEDAPPIANPNGKKNPFAGSGFSSRLRPTG